MAVTHAAIAAAGTSLILGTFNPLPLGLAILGSQLPDLDTTTSTIGKIFFPLSSWIEDRFPHRSVTHSLLATVGVAVFSLGIGHFLLGDIKIAIALPLGHLLACFSDTFTKQGVQLFYPNPAWAISVSNPRRRLKTGGAGELWVLAIAIALLTLDYYLANGGGVTTKVSQSLGLKDGIVRIYNQNAATNHVYADIKGVWKRDRTNADGRYWILGNEGSEFIVTDGQGIYKTNEQIVVGRLTTDIGGVSSINVSNIIFNDEDPITTLEKLKNSSDDAALFLSGQITVDFPEDVKLPTEPKQMQKVSLSGGSLKFSYCPVDTAIALLKGQYAIGTLEVKTINPKPNI
jgi:inner membrane protein